MTYAEIGQILAGTTAFLLFLLAGYGWGYLRYKVPGSKDFVLLTLACAVWCIGYTLELGQTVADGFLAAYLVGYLGLAFVPTFWLFLSLNWVEHPLARSKRLRGSLLTVAFSLLVLVWTNDLHHWWFQALAPTGKPGFARIEPGWAYYLLDVLYLLAFVANLVMLVTRKKVMPLFRKKAVVLLTANILSLGSVAAFQLGFRPGGLDPSVFSLLPVFAVLAWGMFRHDLIRIVPIARDMVVESLDEAVLVLDPTGRVVDYNAAATPLLPFVEDTLRSSLTPLESITLELPEGNRTFRMRRSEVRGQGGVSHGSVFILSDITAERRLLEELTHRASHDSLTGIANRRHFEEHALGEITRAGRHGGTLALVLFDLDWFKSINDRFGHPTGDRVLKAVVDVVSSKLRPYDFLARLGGEEFVVLMPEAQPTEAREAAERWRAALETTPQVLPGAVLPVTASFGVASLNDLPFTLSNDSQVKLDALLGLADKALYQAKAEGRNRVC